jgi:hypothetical protein
LNDRAITPHDIRPRAAVSSSNLPHRARITPTSISCASSQRRWRASASISDVRSRARAAKPLSDALVETDRYGIGGIPWTMREMTEEKMIVFRT